MSKAKISRRQKIRFRIRHKIQGTAERPRLSVFRSNNQIYAQLINDLTGSTICAASSKEDGISDQKSTKVDQASKVGKLIAEKAKSAGVATVVFDRSGYLYHGRVKALADGAREAGLNF